MKPIKMIPKTDTSTPAAKAADDKFAVELAEIDLNDLAAVTGGMYNTVSDGGGGCSKG